MASRNDPLMQRSRPARVPIAEHSITRRALKRTYPTTASTQLQ